MKFKNNIKYFVYIITSLLIMGFSKSPVNEKVSHSYLKSYGVLEDATPIFNTTDGILTVRFESKEGGHITNCRLIGTGGSFTLGEGRHEIPPGQYTHYLVGGITNRGEIHSYITYN